MLMQKMNDIKSDFNQNLKPNGDRTRQLLICYKKAWFTFNIEGHTLFGHTISPWNIKTN